MIWLSAAPAYLYFTLYVVKCGSGMKVIETTPHLRTIIIDTVPICKDFLVELRLLSSGVRIHKAVTMIRDLPSFCEFHFSAPTKPIRRRFEHSARLRGSDVPVESSRATR